VTTPVTRCEPPGLLLGVGMGGFVDGIVLHQIHRVRPDSAANPGLGLGFLALGVLLVGGGWALQRHDQRRADRPVGGGGVVSGGER